MSKVLVRIYSWEDASLYETDLNLAVGDMVIVPGSSSNEVGIVEAVNVNIEEEEKPLERVLRLATSRDREVFEQHEKQKDELVYFCRQEAQNFSLEMKVVDARISLDGKQITFVFTADGRVDFRELVKILSKEYKKAIRMQQIGSRDEARKLGGFGICGRNLCCVSFRGSIQSITTDMARVQQIAHRGAERISGLCGRLMCCLAYEAEQYKSMLSGMPEVYSVVMTQEGKGTVIEVNAVTQEIKVKLESGKYAIIKKEDIREIK